MRKLKLVVPQIALLRFQTTGGVQSLLGTQATEADRRLEERGCLPVHLSYTLMWARVGISSISSALEPASYLQVFLQNCSPRRERLQKTTNWNLMIGSLELTA